MRILAIDPGLKKIGLAVCDPTGTVAHALEVFLHKTVLEDAQRIASLAEKEGAGLILLGISHTAGKAATPITRFTHQLMAAVRAASAIPVALTDEAFSTQAAKQTRIERGEGRTARRAPDDALAAAALLQEYLDAHFKS
jgi:putative holliday junction resolvase